MCRPRPVSTRSVPALPSAAGGVPRSVINVLETAVVGSTRPDLTIIFDVPPELGLQRAAKRMQPSSNDAPPVDRFETMSLAFHRNLHDEFWP